MNENKKPKLCELLGVEPGERFQIKYEDELTKPMYVGNDGYPRHEGGTVCFDLFFMVFYAINHPEKVVCQSQWDEDELALLGHLRKIGGQIATKDKDGRIDIWIGTPSDVRKNSFGFWWNAGTARRMVTILTVNSDPDPLPHLDTDRPIVLDEVLNETKN